MNWRLPLISVLVALVGLATPAAHAGSAPLPGDSIYQLRATLTNHAGKQAAWSDQRGRPRLIAMFYASCPYMCPLIIESGKAVNRALTPQEQARLGITLVSIDPKRDTPVALIALGTKRKIDFKQWTLLRPAPQDVRPLAGLLGVRYKQMPDGEFNHTSALVLVSADGRILARTEKMGSQPDPEFVAAVQAALRVRKP